MDIKSFTRAIEQIAKQRGIPSQKVIETLTDAIAAAYKKDYGEKGQKIRANLDAKSGKVEFWQEKMVVNKPMIYSEKEMEKIKEGEKEKEEDKVFFNSKRHIKIKEAKKIKSDVKAGEVIEIPLETQEDYGRIAAQTAKQVILQKIREAEKDIIYNEYKEKEGEIASGLIQRIENATILVDVGKTLGILAREEKIRKENYRVGNRMKFYISKVEKSSKGPKIFLSRAHPKLISKLFELEVPEVSSGAVEIKSIAREPGFRTKIAVTSDQEGIDPIGACVGQRGTRIMAVINEIGGEKIDVVEWSEKPEDYIANSLSPAKILEVKIGKKNTAKVLVPEDQLSLAIGKDGRNVRLAVNLTGWKIDVKAQKSPGEGRTPAGISEGGKEDKAVGEKKEKAEAKEEKEKKKAKELKQQKNKKKKPKKKKPKKKEKQDK